MATETVVTVPLEGPTNGLGDFGSRATNRLTPQLKQKAPPVTAGPSATDGLPLAFEPVDPKGPTSAAIPATPNTAPTEMPGQERPLSIQSPEPASPITGEPVADVPVHTQERSTAPEVLPATLATTADAALATKAATGENDLVEDLPSPKREKNTLWTKLGKKIKEIVTAPKRAVENVKERAVNFWNRGDHLKKGERLKVIKPTLDIFFHLSQYNPLYSWKNAAQHWASIGLRAGLLALPALPVLLLLLAVPITPAVASALGVVAIFTSVASLPLRYAIPYFVSPNGRAAAKNYINTFFDMKGRDFKKFVDEKLPTEGLYLTLRRQNREALSKLPKAKRQEALQQLHMAAENTIMENSFKKAHQDAAIMLIEPLLRARFPEIERVLGFLRTKYANSNIPPEEIEEHVQEQFGQMLQQRISQLPLQERMQLDPFNYILRHTFEQFAKEHPKAWEEISEEFQLVPNPTGPTYAFLAYQAIRDFRHYDEAQDKAQTINKQTSSSSIPSLALLASNPFIYGGAVKVAQIISERLPTTAFILAISTLIYSPIMRILTRATTAYTIAKSQILFERKQREFLEKEALEKLQMEHATITEAANPQTAA